MTIDDIKILADLARVVLDSDDAESYLAGIGIDEGELQAILGRDPDVVTFVLADEDGKTLDVGVAAVGGFLNLQPKDYSQPVSLDFHSGRLRALVNADATIDEPQVIDLELANCGLEATCAACGHTDRQDEFWPSDGRDDRLSCPKCENTNAFRRS